MNGNADHRWEGLQEVQDTGEYPVAGEHHDREYNDTCEHA